MVKAVCTFCGQTASKGIGDAWLCADCAAQAQVEVRIVPGGFGVYVYIYAPPKATRERMAYLERHDGDWTREQMDALTRKVSNRRREIAAS